MKRNLTTTLVLAGAFAVFAAPSLAASDRNASDCISITPGAPDGAASVDGGVERAAPAASPGKAAGSAPVSSWTAGHKFRDCPECPELVVIPAGTYRMGSERGEGDEKPVHDVRIGYPLAVGVFEVTFGEWDACVSGGGCGGHRPDNGWGRGRRPVINVGWGDAQVYVRWLSERTGQAYRLLSESEWEYVARAGTVTARYWGESETGQCRYANGADASTDFDWRTGCNDGHARTAPVGSFSPNGFGLHDVLGNVWEWVEDCWNGSYAGAPTDGSAWLSGECEHVVLRGGSWYDTPQYLRSADRSWDTTWLRLYLVGFRVARTLD